MQRGSDRFKVTFTIVLFLDIIDGVFIVSVRMYVTCNIGEH